ncbi:MAG: pyridoxal-dependent decarboxylase [Pseudomonadota bacterium]
MSAAPADPLFSFDAAGLRAALETLRVALEGGTLPTGAAPQLLPAQGQAPSDVLCALAGLALEPANRFNSAGWFAHMDPPTPWITWAAQAWISALNQNLLHPDTGAAGRDVEAQVIAALAPVFGMAGGHMVPGSTVANLTALWAAREVAGVTEVVASEHSHLSVAKAAHILGLGYRSVPCDPFGRMDAGQLGELGNSCLVLTAGTTSTGSVDRMEPRPEAAWLHVDAAWAGPLMFSGAHRHRLAGLEQADSVAISAHKWLWQPKDSALALFRNAERAHEAVSFGGAYLAVPNVGVLGSSAARAIPLAATLMTMGVEGIVSRLDTCMALAERFADLIEGDGRFELWNRPETGVIAWRPSRGEPVRLREGLAERGLHVSQTVIGGAPWLRSVAVHPGIDVDAVYAAACQLEEE